jgi:hypothetical protein
MKDNKKKSLDGLKDKEIKKLTKEEEKKLKGGDGNDGGKGTDPLPEYP